jgi:hypothetical protein
MSCPIHDRCTCYGAPLQYTTSMTTGSTSMGSPHSVPQTNNILLGYEWAAPLVTSSAAWYPVEPVIIQPPTLHSGQEIIQSDRYRLGNMHEASPLHSAYHRESRVHHREQKQASSFREQVRFPLPHIPLRAKAKVKLATQHPYPTPYIQGVSRMAMPSHASLLQSHRSSTSSLSDYDGLSQIAAMNPDRPDPLALFDEPPPPYPNNSLLVSPLSDVFPQSVLLPTERHLDVGSFTPSPLAPVPLRHSSLYQVLKQDTAISPAQGTLQSGVSSIAHALEPQELQARQVPPACLSVLVLGNSEGPTVSTSESALSTLSTSQSTSATSLAVVAAADPCPTLPQLPTLAPSSQAQPPVSSATPPSESVRAQNGSVVTPSQVHTLMQPIPEVTTQDYDTLPRLRKVSPPLLPLALSKHADLQTFTKAASSHPAGSCVAWIRQRRSICGVKPTLTSVIAPVIFDGRSGDVLTRR